MTAPTMQSLADLAQRRAEGLAQANAAQAPLLVGVKAKIPEYLELQIAGEAKPYHAVHRSTLQGLRAALEGDHHPNGIGQLGARLAHFAQQETEGQP